MFNFLRQVVRSIAQKSTHTFPRNFPVDGEVAKLLLTRWQQVVVMEFGKRHDITDFVTDLLQTCLCCRLVTGKSLTCYGLATEKLVQLILAL